MGGEGGNKGRAGRGIGSENREGWVGRGEEGRKGRGTGGKGEEERERGVRRRDEAKFRDGKERGSRNIQVNR